jgi:hypothetical protein
MRMKHYDYIEWLLYKNKALSDEKLKEMEAHLYNCDICMDIFLSLVSEDEIKMAGSMLTNDFTDKVIDKLPKYKVEKKEIEHDKKHFYYQFGIYAAVATVTIVMSLSGVFTHMVDAVPKIASSIQVNDQCFEQNIIVKLSDRIINSTSYLITSIENISN